MLVCTTGYSTLRGALGDETARLQIGIADIETFFQQNVDKLELSRKFKSAVKWVFFDQSSLRFGCHAVGVRFRALFENRQLKFVEAVKDAEDDGLDAKRHHQIKFESAAEIVFVLEKGVDLIPVIP